MISQRVAEQIPGGSVEIVFHDRIQQRTFEQIVGTPVSQMVEDLLETFRFLPHDSDSYLHRVGQAERFGTKGLANAFVSS